MTRTPAWEPTDADLVAYLLDDLEGARAEYVAAHIEACTACRARLAALERAILALDGLPDPEDADLQRRSMLQARIQGVAADNSAQVSRGWTRHTRVSVILLTVLVAVLVIGPSLTGAGSYGIDQLVRVVPGWPGTNYQPRSVPPGRALPTIDRAGAPGRPTIEPSALPYAPIAPDSLPGSNRLVSTTAYENGLFEAHYQGEDGLELKVDQSPAIGRGIEVEEDVEFIRMRIRDIDVVVLIDEDLNSVSLMTWARGGFRFSLLAMRSGRNDFPLEEATQVVERLMELQDDPEGP